MFSRAKPFAMGLATLAVAACSAVFPAEAGSRDKLFFESVQGEWSGPGEIVDGKYKGTKFKCTLTGTAENKAGGITLDGRCRVGVFTQPVKAVILASGRTYKGKFLDGAAGNGLDIVSGNITGQKMVVGLVRAKLNGAMIARVQGKNTMTVTISVKDGDRMRPVIGMSLQREADEMAVGSIK